MSSPHPHACILMLIAIGCAVLTGCVPSLVQLDSFGLDPSAMAKEGDWAPYPNEFLATVPVGDGPSALAYTPDGSQVWVANMFDDSVTIFQTSDHSIASIIAGGDGPVGVAFSPDGARAYVVTYYGCSLQVIDTADGSLIAVIPVSDLSYDPLGLLASPDGSRVYVANHYSSRVAVVDTAELAVAQQIAVPGRPEGMALTPDGKVLYVANLWNVLRIDTESLAVTNEITAGSFTIPVTITAMGDLLYVGNSRSDSVSVISTAGDTVLATVPAIDCPQALALTPDGEYLFVANHDAGTVTVIETATNAVVETIPSGTDNLSMPYAVAISPDGSSAYVANWRHDTVTILLGEPPAPQVLTVEMVLGDGAAETVINTRSRGMIEAVVATTDTFDVADVDVPTVNLAGAPVASRGKSGKLHAEFVDVDFDGDMDLVLKFRVPDLQIASDATEVVLGGLTTEGEKFTAAAAVTVTAR
ncbi:MAG: YncE family protein [Phycisphaerae bacterium]|nr:YncE family protein [Phycisphaerae bacterium]